MRKAIVAILALTCVIPLCRAQSCSGRFEEVRTPSKTSGKQAVTLRGQLDYTAGGNLSMVYDNGELFLIEGTSMTIRRDGKGEQVFDTSKNIMMRSLRDALVLAFEGKTGELAAEQKAVIETSPCNGGTRVVLTATKKQARGYSRIVVLYSGKGLLQEMTMDEFTGASTYYKFL